jgi:hypothetical protein
MSYRLKFIRRRVRERIRIDGENKWKLVLECGHEIEATSSTAMKVINPACPTCNTIAADIGRSKRLVDDLPARTK